MAKLIAFCDLTHTGQTVCANAFPLGAAMVAAYAKQELGEKIELEIFKYPDDFSQYLGKYLPDIAAFSSYSWNNNLGYEYACRIKKFSPNTVIIFGGENFPGYGGNSAPWVRKLQKSYFRKYPTIDFFIFGEAEYAFVELFKKLEIFHFDVSKLKAEKAESPNVLYMVDDELVTSSIIPRIGNLDKIPSVYADGLCDKFFDGLLTPMIETARGCPFSCTFCTDGHQYSNKTKRFSRKRIEWELEYIAKKANVNELIITDLNFGMFKEDIDTAMFIASLQEKYDYPRYLVQASAKNQKDRVIEISRILRGMLAPGASVQSTAPEVLDAIKRKNLTLEQLMEVSKTRENDDASSLSEVILCLPQDSKVRHFRSVFDMIDAGVTLLRNHQFMLLKGTEAESLPSREHYMMKTAFRVQPRCFGIYKLWDEEFSTVEIEEICVANSTMSYEDYRECRNFNLTIEIFLNDGIFYEFFRLIDHFKISRSTLIREIHDSIIQGDGFISQIYKQYRSEEMTNLSDSYEKLARYTSDVDVVRNYISGELGSNEIYKYRALALFHHMEELHKITCFAVRRLIGNSLGSDSIMAQYFSELCEFSLLRKQNFLNCELSKNVFFHFDFVTLLLNNYSIEPQETYVPEGIEIELFHTERQKQMIKEWLQQHGTTINGLGRLLSRAQVSALYRQAQKINPRN